MSAVQRCCLADDRAVGRRADNPATLPQTTGRPSQLLSIERLASIAVGDALDSAMAAPIVDSFKTELISDRVWRTRTQLELAIVEYVGWFNTTRLHEALGDLPPAEFETLSPSSTVHLSLS